MIYIVIDNQKSIMRIFENLNINWLILGVMLMQVKF